MQGPISLQSFQAFTEYIKTGDFSGLINIYQFYEEIIIPIISSSPNLLPIFRDPLFNLLIALQKRVSQMPQIPQKLPQLPPIIEQIRRILGDPKREVCPPRDQSIQDKYFIKFLKDQQAKLINPNNSSYHDIEQSHQNRQKIRLKMQALISTRIFKGQWQVVFSALREHSKSQRNESYPAKSKSLSLKLHNQRISMPQCIGCAQFFYENINIRDLQLVKIDILVHPRISEINLHKETLKADICAMLNSTGGIILFDCLDQYMEILPVGTAMSELRKEEYQQQISEVFKYFRPKIAFGRNVDLKFVPVVQNPLSNINNLDKQNLEFIKGRYVPRLRIWNNQRYRLIFIEDVNGQLVAFTRSQGKTVKMKTRSLTRQIKKVFSKFYCPENVNKNIFAMPQHCFEDHKCIEPKKGIQIKGNIKDVPSRQTEYDLEIAFKYVSFMFLRNTTAETIEKGFKTQQTHKFRVVPHDPPTSDNFCLLFHDSSHRDMKEAFHCIIASSPKGKSNDHENSPVLLFVENALKLSQILSDFNFKQLVKYIRGKNSTETLKYLKREREVYLVAGFKVSLFFLLGKLKEMKYHNTKVVRLDIKLYENDEKVETIEVPVDYQ